MKVAVLGAGEDAIASLEQARKLNITTLALDDLAQAPGYMAADGFQIIDYSRPEEIISLLKQAKVDFLMPFVEGEKAVLAGKLNDALKLPGYGEKAARICVDKYLFHKKLREKGLRMHHSFLLTKDYLFDPFEITYPAIVKPRYAATGAEHIYYMSCPGDLVEFQVKHFGLKPEMVEEKNRWKGKKASSAEGGKVQISTPGDWKATVAAKEEQNKQIREELLRLYRELQELDKKQEKTSLSGLEWLVLKKQELAVKNRGEEAIDTNAEYVLEEVFEGQEYAVDAAMEGCNFEIVMIRKALMTPPPAMQAVGYITVLPEEDRVLYERMKKYLDRVVEVIGLRDCMFRADVRVKGKEFFAVHVAPVPAPSRIHDEMLPLATGIHIGREYLCYMSGRRHNFQPIQVKKTMLHYFDMENCFVHAVPLEKEVKLSQGIQLKRWKCAVKTLDYLDRITTGESLSGRGYYILEGDREQSLLQMAENINGMFHTC